MRWFLCASLLFVLASPSVFAQVPESKLLADKLAPMLEKHEGEVGFMVKHLKTSEQFSYRADEVMPTASLCKLGQMVAAYRRAEVGDVDLNAMITLSKEDMVPGSGILTNHFSPGATISLRDAIRLMMVYSDNTATNLVADAIGMRATSDEMTALGFSETKIHSKVFRRNTSVFPERSQEYGLGSTTARETVGLLHQIYNKKCASEASCEAMLEHLASCDDDTKVAAGLPAGTRYANKTGAISNVRCDAGIIFAPNGPIAICVLTRKNKDQSWSKDNAAHKLCADLGRATFEHFNPGGESAKQDGPLKIGSFGALVESLQRTLNARLNPSPGLSVDGDFGPATESAVRTLQETKNLPVTGIVNPATWKALGTVVAEAPVPEPEVVNAGQPETESPDTLTGSPFVSCRGYAIINAETGELLFGEKPNEQREPASTTKIMTAWLVLRHAVAHPDVLDETITFSKRADLTRGSTSGLRVGEKVPVAESLYGLMLPSGNDMAVALAEHFGSRLATGAADADPLALFVEAMNAEASRLGMTNTVFRNPHGLPDSRHVTTPFDLAILARSAFGNPLFRKYVAATKRGVKVQGPGGYSRNVVWENTNRLLGIQGYDGVKTGTTTNAGACLVSTAKRENVRLFVTVLGSSGSSARYADTRNLYRWAWNQLQVK